MITNPTCRRSWSAHMQLCGRLADVLLKLGAVMIDTSHIYVSHALPGLIDCLVLIDHLNSFFLERAVALATVATALVS